jgi:Na+-translocating ferredoxin:NAD+ oxidoreductase RnfA subunit
VRKLSELSRLFLNSLLSENMSLAFFLGILFMMVESGSIKKTAVKGLKYLSTVFVINILGWFLHSFLPSGLDPLNPAIFFITTVLGITVLKYWGELKGEWFGLPKFILALGPLFGTQLLIQRGAYAYAEMMTVNTAYILGGYILFVLIAAIKEEIIVSDAAPVFKSYSTLLAAIAMLALGVIGIQII